MCPELGQIVFVFSVEGTVTLELAFSATIDAVPNPPYRARYLKTEGCLN